MGDPPVGDDHTAQSDDNGAPAVAQRLKAILASPSEPFPSFVGGQESAFQSIVSQLAAAGLPSPRSTQYPPPPPAILGNARRPDAIPEADWVPVHDQLNTELVFKEETHSLFESYYEYFTNVYVENLTYLTTTALPEVGEVGDDEGTVIVGAMISAGASAVEAAGEDIPGVGVIVGIGEAVIDKVQHGTDIPPSQLVKLGSEMGTFLSKSFNTCLAYVQTTEKSVLEDWGKLEPMGRAITDQTVAWPVPDTQWIDVAVDAYRVSLWKTILPVVWDIISSDTNPELQTSTDWVAGYIEKNPNYYISCTPTSGGYSCDMFWLGRGTMVINAKSPSDDMCHEIFDNLAVPRSDVFNEWKGFARKRWMPGGGCGTPVMVAGLSRVRGDSDAVSQSLLNELRDFRDRIKPSPLGGWLVEIYNRISNPIAHIYEKDTQLKNAIAQYDGDALWAKIAGIVQGDTTRLTNNDIGNGLAIISATMQLAAEEWGDNNWVSVAIRALLPILPTYEQARSEDQLVELIAAGTPPETIEQLFAGTVKPTWDDFIGAEENDRPHDR